MKKINIVYAYMREPRYEIALPEHDALAVWTVVEEPDADVVIYHSGYSYDARRAADNPTAFRILYTYEPLVVCPGQFLRRFWKPFDAVLTWNETLLEQGGKFVRFPSLYYDFPFSSAHGVACAPVCPPDWRGKKRAMCQIAGNKYTFMPSELYSRRRSIARWFGHHGKLPLDTFGVPPMKVPGYCGSAADKRETMSQYRYALCLENNNHPLWSTGYVTEKIFDCFYAFSVPVYLGAPDVEKNIPPECFIDLRNFPSLAELDEYLLRMSDEEYCGYLTAIERFLQVYDAPHKHSCFRLYEKALELAAAGPVPPPETQPFGLWEKASLKEKAGYLLMAAALPVYKKIFQTRYAGTR
jgi:hypothetical protein